MKMIVCWTSATYFQFHLQQFACWLAEEISAQLLIRGDVYCISAVVSDYNIHIAYKTYIILRF